MELEVFGIDAFYGKVGKGNLAGVCIPAKKLNDEQLQHIATQFNASETAFITKETDGYHLRWFTPTNEVDLCGHGTLAAAFVLWDRGLHKDDEISFHTASGLLTCKRGPYGRIEMKFPEHVVQPVLIPETQALEALGIMEAVFVGKSGKYVVIELSDEKTLRALQPNFEKLKVHPQRGFLVTARSAQPDYDFVSRCFFPKEGIPEDPVTGSAHCALGPYWKKKLEKDSLKAYQASARGGEIEITFQPEKVLLAGRARFSDTQN